MDRKNFILKDNLWRVMFKLSWPAVLAMVLYGANTVLDAFFVGRFVGENALAGVSLAYPLTQIALGFGSLIGVGAGSALSIALGSHDLDKQKKILANVNYSSVLIGLVYMILGFVFAEPLLKMMGGQGQALVEGVSYYKITVLGTIFWILGLAYNMIIRAEGKMTSAARMMAYGLVVNGVANYIFIVVLDFGVKGAAWGTNIGMLVYTLVGILYFTKRASFQAKIFSFARHKDIMKSIISMGFPSFIMSVMSLIQAIVVFNALRAYGTTSDIAFFGIAYRIFTFSLTPIFGLMRALQPVVGINFGANHFRRVTESFKVFTLAGIVMTLPIWLLVMVFSKGILTGMMPDYILTGQDLFNFRIFASILPLMPVVFMGLTFFTSIDKSKPASIIGISRQVVFYIPVMLILPRLFGVNWVYIGSMIIDIVIGLWVLILVLKESRQLNQLGEVKSNTSIS